MAEANNIFDSPITNFRIAEAAADGMLIDVHVISPGWGSFGYYSESVLRAACTNGVYPAGMHMHIDHPTRKAAQEQPGRTIKGESPLAAIFTEAGHYTPNGWDKTAENPTGAGVYSVAKVLPTFVEDMKAMAGNIGISHYVEGKRESGVAPDGRKGQIIKELVADQWNTVDFVTVPGAKGKYRLAFSEMKIRQDSTENAESIGENMADKQESLTLSEVRTSHPEIFEEMKASLSKELMIEAATKDQTVKLNEAATKIKTLEQENKGLKTMIAEGKAREFVATQLKEAKIPEVSGKVLIESLIKQVVLSEDGSINAAEFGKIVTDAVKVKAEEIAAIIKESKSGIHDNGGSAPPAAGDVTKAKEGYIRVLMEGGMSKEQAEQLAEE